MLKSIRLFSAVAVGLLFASLSASAALQINEVLNNAPGGGDDGQEFVEIIGTASESVSGVFLLYIDNNGGSIGTVENVVDLSSAGTVGTNGLLLVRDAAAVLSPAPDAATTVLVNDFAPDLDNDSGTFLLVTAFTGSVSDDLDTNDDGTLETTPWTTLLDAVGYIDPDSEPSIAIGLGGAAVDGGGVFTPDFIARDSNNHGTLYGGDVNGSSPGPYTIDAVEVTNAAFAGLDLTPGSINESLVTNKALVFNEVLNNAPGGGDDGQEFVELKGNVGESVDDVWILVLDNNGGGIGAVENAIDLSASLTTGTNGLLLVRDSATVLSPAPAAATTLQITDFNPDIDNDSITLLLVTGFTGTVSDDLDTDDDGTLDTTPWTDVLDAIFIDDGDSEPAIAVSLGGVSTGPQTFTPDVIHLDPTGSTLVIGDVDGTNPGPYTFAVTETIPVGYEGVALSPGSPNNTGALAPGLSTFRVPFLK